MKKKLVLFMAALGFGVSMSASAISCSQICADADYFCAVAPDSSLCIGLRAECLSCYV